MTTRKYSFTRKSRALAVAVAKDAAPDLTNLDDEAFQRIRKRIDSERVDIATKLFKAVNDMDESVSLKRMTSVQWSEIFYHIIYSVGIHNKKYMIWPSA